MVQMNEVERIHQDLLAIQALIGASADVSAIAAYGEHSAKTLLLAGASYFERKVLSAVQTYLDKSTQSSVLRHFVYHQAVDRKFFSLFDFSAKAKNISPFLGKFGQGFSTWAEKDMPKKGVDKESQLTFVNFCRLRNSLVHGNYATFAINKTLAEVRSAFDEAAKVLVWIEGAFESFEKEALKPDDLKEGGSDGSPLPDAAQ
jgi:hypothetical protein